MGNQLGVINMCQAAVNFIVNQNSPSDRIIVNVSSVAGMEVKPYVPVYRATKHAVVAYTRTMAVRLFKQLNHLQFHRFIFHFLNLRHVIILKSMA